jgi:DNA repair exonuclease SbcCD ATPase subunit
VTPEQIDRLEAEADEALKQATATPETDKVEAAQEAEAQANADEIETQVVEPEESKADEPNADEEVAAAATESEEDNSENFETDGVSIKNAQQRIQNAQASYENARKKMTQASMEASELRKQNEALQAQLENSRTVAKVPPLIPSEAPPPRPEAAEADDLSSFVNEYGEDFNPLVSNIRNQQQLINKMSGQLSEMEKSRQASASKTAQVAHREAIIEGHADAYDIVDTPDFQGWSSRQPKEIQDILITGNPDSVIWMLSSYKEAVGASPVNAKADKQKQLLDDAKKAADPAVSSVRSNNSGQKTTQFTRDQIKNMSLAEYEKHADQIDQAMLSGQL